MTGWRVSSRRDVYKRQIMGRASRLLKSSGQGDKAKEMRDRVMFCDSYQKALSIVSEYVETELSPSPTPKRDRGDAR